MMFVEQRSSDQHPGSPNACTKGLTPGLMNGAQ
jgi:hypothetical protein